jgi:hypothetical protein
VKHEFENKRNKELHGIIKNSFAKRGWTNTNLILYSRLGKVGNQVMDNTIRVFSGRAFRPEDIEMIKWARKTYPNLPRHEFAATVCELLGWTTPAGRAKQMQCIT